ELGGAATGALITLTGGTPAAVGGALAAVGIGRTLQRVGSEVAERWLSRRQQVRVGGAVLFAGEEVQRRLAEGDVPREDVVTDDDSPDRPSSDEVLEGVLWAAAQSYEEAKVRHLGYLYASIAFDPSISPATANLLISLAERLTYRQMELLQVFATSDFRIAE